MGGSAPGVRGCTRRNGLLDGHGSGRARSLAPLPLRRPRGGARGEARPRGCPRTARPTIRSSSPYSFAASLQKQMVAPTERRVLGNPAHSSGRYWLLPRRCPRGPPPASPSPARGSRAESIVALVCGGAIGSLLVYGYQKWVKKR